MGKTAYIQVMTLLVFLGIFSGVYLTYQGFFSSASKSLPTLHYITNSILNITWVLISTIYFTKLYKLKSDAPRWTNISFGYGIFYNFVGIVVSILTFGPIALLAVIPAVIASFFGIILWITFYLHLKKAVAQGRIILTQ